MENEDKTKIDFDSRELLLFTGAGFTKNFGGSLGHEMWLHAFNNPLVQKSGRLKAALQKSRDFEAAYSHIVSSSSEGEKEIMRQITEEAYHILDEITKDWLRDLGTSFLSPVNIAGLRNFLDIFRGGENKKGFFFTLNQDLFMERLFKYRSPGLPFFPADFYHPYNRELRESDFCLIPDKKEAAERGIAEDISIENDLSYLKLHGSYGWISPSGRKPLVIGRDKKEIIAGEPLLASYFRIFEETVKDGGKKMLVIGYSFGDRHINRIFLEGIRDYGLKIYLLNTDPFQAVERRLIDEGFHPGLISKGLCGYFPYALADIFPIGREETSYCRQIKNSLLA